MPGSIARGLRERSALSAATSVSPTASMLLTSFTPVVPAQPEPVWSGVRQVRMKLASAYRKYENSPFVQEKFHEDWSKDQSWGWQQNRAVVGHNLKIAWNLMRMNSLRSKEYWRKVDRERAYPQEFVQALYRNVERGVRKKQDLKTVFDSTARQLRKKYSDWAIFEHCLPFDITRCYDEVSGIYDPRIWTAKRDIEMWKTLQD